MNCWAVLPTPTASDAAHAVLEQWRDAGFRLMALVDDASDFRFPVPTVRAPQYKGWAWAMNELCRHAASYGADLVTCIGDDLLPRDGLAADRLADAWRGFFGDSTYGVMQCTGDDYGEIHHAAVSPTIGREYIARHRPFFEGYRHLYADRELQDVAAARGVFRQCASLTIYHDHWTRGQTPDRLPADRRGVIHGAAKSDAALYESRKASGFPE